MRPFILDDLSEINRWYRAHGAPDLPPELVPAAGLIIPGVAVGFVRRAECGISIIDSVGTNREKSSLERHEALEQLCPALLELAWRGSRLVLIYTQDRGIIGRAERLGFSLRACYFELSRS